MPAVRPVDVNSLHLTLRFLGPTPVKQERSLCIALDQSMDQIGPIPLAFKGLGRFDVDSRRPLRTIFANIVQVKSIGQIAKSLDQNLAALRWLVPAQQAPLQPHVTLARVKTKPSGALLTFLENHREVDLGACRIEQVHLIASELTRSGPVYHVCYTRQLVADV